jgi:hypothetical protein
MNQAKNWFRWATQKKQEARARGEMGKTPRTIGRRGLVGNEGQPNTHEIARAVYEEDVARKAAEERHFQEYMKAHEKSMMNARANGWSPNPQGAFSRPNWERNRPPPGARNLPMRFVQAGIYGGKSRRRRSPRRRGRTQHGRTQRGRTQRRR